LASLPNASRSAHDEREKPDCAQTPHGASGVSNSGRVLLPIKGRVQGWDRLEQTQTRCRLRNEVRKSPGRVRRERRRKEPRSGKSVRCNVDKRAWANPPGELGSKVGPSARFVKQRWLKQFPRS